MRKGAAAAPELTVVMPVHRDADVLGETAGSILEQSLGSLELILVADRPDPITEVELQRLAGLDRRVRLMTAGGAGPSAARNTGAAAARGRFLAFRDADDPVPKGATERLVGLLRSSGSDLAAGSLTMQQFGRHATPPWAAAANPRRQTAAGLVSVPHLAANFQVGSYVFSTRFWREAGLRFDERSNYADPAVVADALSRANMIDTVPAVVHRWCRRVDGSSLAQMAERESSRASEQVRQLSRAASRLEQVPEAQAAFQRAALQTVVTTLIRAAVALGQDYWSALSREVASFIDGWSPETWSRLPVEDRLLAWLCARDHREETEEFLMYAFDNATGFPTALRGGRPHVRLDVIGQFPDAGKALTALEHSDLRFRCRLFSMRWAGMRLHIEGAALVEYLPLLPEEDASTVVILQEVRTGIRHRVPTSPARDLDVNQWANRSHEDHSRAGFRATLDLSSLETDEPSIVYDVLVEHRVGGREWCTPFGSREAEGSAGLSEERDVGRFAARAIWREHSGLRLALRPGMPVRLPQPDQAVWEVVPPTVTAIEVDEGAEGPCLVVTAKGGGDDLEVALEGPRCRTPYVACEAHPDTAGRTRARLPLAQDDWGVGRAALPADRYLLRWRAAASTDPGGIEPSTELWRELPTRHVVGDLQVLPVVGARGFLGVRIWPLEWVNSRSAFDRRRLRDAVYPAARELPLQDLVFFETFHGRSAGDNPGGICEELLHQGTDLELAFCVIDRSVVLPPGVRSIVRFSREYFELLARARYVVTNASTPYFFRKREGQVCLQTWHGTPLKRIAHDRPNLDFFNWHHRRQLLEARNAWDALLTQSDFCTTALQSAFLFEGPVLQLGYPRNDVLSSVDAPCVREETRRRLGIAPDAFVVLYAPTWRDNQRVGQVFDKVLFLETDKVLSGIAGSVVLVRGHYNSIKAAESVDPGRRVIDVTRYPDIAHLYLAADALVTDYSSVFFDFALVDKPMAFLAPDLDAYRDDNRGFYLDYHETVPGPVCEDTEAVVAAFTAPDDWKGRRAEFRGRYAPLDDGRASARVLAAILHPEHGGSAAVT